MKKTAWFGIILLLFMMLCGPAYADGAAGPLVVDMAGLFTQEQTEELTSRAHAMGDKYDLDIVIVTTNQTGGKSSQDFADDYYDDNGYGRGSDASGLLLLIDMQNRNYWISTCGSAIGRFDSHIDSILDAMEDSMRDQEYGDAAEDFLNKVRHILNPYPRYALFSIVGGVILAVIVSCILASRHNRQLRPYQAQAYISRPLKLTRQDDRFHSTHTTRVRRPRDEGSHGGRSGGSSTHTSSSGRSHGGGGRSF